MVAVSSAALDTAAYETRLSAGSTAMLSDDQEDGALTRNCTRLACLPSRRIAQKCFGGIERWLARDDLHVQGCLVLSQVGLLFPVNHAPSKWRP